MTDQTDIVERLRNQQCEFGCNTAPICSCARMDEAADLITSLRAQVAAAERKGMLRAAEICEAQRKCHPDDDYYDCQEQCENAIRAEANK